VSILLDTKGALAIQTISLSLFRFTNRRERLWAFTQMGFARLSLRKIKGMQFYKLCGSGTGEGFSPRPNWGVYTLLATWPDIATARRAIETESIFTRYRRHAAESYTLFLRATSSRGHWSRNQPFETTGTPGHGPIAALTRATIKPSTLLKFWRHVPDISAMIGRDPNVCFKIGMGEVPWLHQITFSIWPNERAMANFARHNGPHANAIKDVRAGDWFAEELYARFQILEEIGTWEGRRSLTVLEQDAA